MGWDCHLDDTEFLTRRGWRTYDEVVDGEEIGTVDAHAAFDLEQLLVGRGQVLGGEGGAGGAQQPLAVQVGFAFERPRRSSYRYCDLKKQERSLCKMGVSVGAPSLR